jgi:hypothetical protein
MEMVFKDSFWVLGFQESAHYRAIGPSFFVVCPGADILGLEAVSFLGANVQ